MRGSSAIDSLWESSHRRQQLYPPANDRLTKRINFIKESYCDTSHEE